MSVIVISPAARLIVTLLAINACAGIAAAPIHSGNPTRIKEWTIIAKGPLGDLKVAQALTEPQPKTSNSDEGKLKQGLINFVNQTNPAPFFVPILPQQQQQQQPQRPENDPKLASKTATIDGAHSSSEPSAMVTDGATVEALVVGPARRFGPMRFG